MRAPPQIFAPARRRAAQRRAAQRSGSEGAAEFLWRDIAEDFRERLDFIRFEPKRALVIGPDAGLADWLAARSAEVDRLTLGERDEESPLPRSDYDLVASIGGLDTVNDLPGALIHLRETLAPGGLLLASFPGSGSLPALRHALLAADGERPAARMHPMVDTRGASGLMERTGFARQVVDSRTIEVTYRAFDRLVGDLRDMGLTNVLASAPPSLGRVGLERARQAFAEQSDSAGRVLENFEVLTLTGWKA